MGCRAGEHSVLWGHGVRKPLPGQRGPVDSGRGRPLCMLVGNRTDGVSASAFRQTFGWCRMYRGVMGLQSVVSFWVCCSRRRTRREWRMPAAFSADWDCCWASVISPTR